MTLEEAHAEASQILRTLDLSAKNLNVLYLARRLQWAYARGKTAGIQTCLECFQTPPAEPEPPLPPYIKPASDSGEMKP